MPNARRVVDALADDERVDVRGEVAEHGVDLVAPHTGRGHGDHRFDRARRDSERPGRWVRG